MQKISIIMSQWPFVQWPFVRDSVNTLWISGKKFSSMTLSLVTILCWWNWCSATTFNCFRTVRVWMKRYTGKYWPTICHNVPGIALELSSLFDNLYDAMFTCAFFCTILCCWISECVTFAFPLYFAFMLVPVAELWLRERMFIILHQYLIILTSIWCIRTYIMTTQIWEVPGVGET